ncbi:12725_t:CDS:2 [Entrophospora sp. SA101]|nr:12725_t:CDS:2 [Entrophospora sp. SA101]
MKYAKAGNPSSDVVKDVSLMGIKHNEVADQLASERCNSEIINVSNNDAYGLRRVTSPLFYH